VRLRRAVALGLAGLDQIDIFVPEPFLFELILAQCGASATSILMWMSLYFLFRYALPTAGITVSEWLTSIAIAAVATVFLFVTFPLIQAFRKAKVARS
jgi:hypothetical protein